jgi:hypothetical protein
VLYICPPLSGETQCCPGSSCLSSSLLHCLLFSHCSALIILMYSPISQNSQCSLPRRVLHRRSLRPTGHLQRRIHRSQRHQIADWERRCWPIRTNRSVGGCVRPTLRQQSSDGALFGKYSSRYTRICDKS